MLLPFKRQKYELHWPFTKNKGGCPSVALGLCAYGTKTSSINEHLLKHTERMRGQVHERLNIIFVDPQYISKPVPHDNKLVDRELDTFPIAIRQGITTLYLRKNNFLPLD